MYECLDLFSPPTRAWFRHAFGTPTDAQREAWPAIHEGGNVLVVAPTGSGKTLCAFLSAIDRLMTERDEDPHASRAARASVGSRRRGVRVLYISPLKALAVDVAKNLETPLRGIAAECGALGLNPPDLHVATRSGDTTPKERRAIAAHPPDILVTTPESLYLLLTSKARRILGTVDTVIVDEIHALAGTKRGAHLALSLARLDLLTDAPAQRIGLSATVNPAAEAARFLGGARPVTVVDPEVRPTMDLRVVEPLPDMRDLQSANAPHRAGGVDAHVPNGSDITGVTPAMRRLAERKGVASGASSDIVGASGDRTSGSIWPLVERSVLDEILAHRTTLVFVNSRGLAEKLTARLNDRYADMRQGGGRGAGGSGAVPPDAADVTYGNSRHYDPVVGSTSALVGSHDPEDEIAMAHHGSVSKERRKQIEERLKHGLLRCVVATSSLELGIDMGSVDLVIQIAPPLSVSSGLQRVGRADHRVGGVSHALFYPLTREQIIGVAASIEGMKSGDIEPLAVPRNPLDILAQQTVAAAAMDDLKPDEWYRTVRRAAPFAELGRDMFDAVMGMMTGAYNTEEFSAFRPPLVWNHDDDIISARPGAQRLAVTSGGTIPDRGLYTVVLPEADAGAGPRRVGELDEEMVYESRVGDVITLGTSTWQIQEITRDRVIVTPVPGRTARLPFWHGDGNGRDAGFGRARGRFLREMAAGLSDEGPGLPQNGMDRRNGSDGPCFKDRINRRLHDDGLDDNAVDNLARLLSEQRAATGAVPSDRRIIIERCPDETGDWRVLVHSPFGRRVHEPWAMAITNRIRQRYGFDGQIYAADDGIVIRLPDTEADLDIRGLILFDPDDLQHAVETQVGESVLFAARFRECAARSLFLPRTDPGKRVPLWQQRLRAAQLLNAARTRHNFPLLLETARECLQDVYDLPALRDVMTRLRAGTIALDDVTTQTPSPFAENLLFGFVGSVMYQYDVPQAERSAQLLSMDPEVLEKLLGGTDMSSVLDPEEIRAVEKRLSTRTFWNELADDDVIGRVARYAKTHGPFTAGRMIADLGVDAADAVHALDELARQGELMSGSFIRNVGVTNDNDGEDVEIAGDGGRQWLHREVFREIRSRSLAKARNAIKPVNPDVYQAFLLDRQGVGPVGGERYEGLDGLLRVLEQLEGIALPARVWEDAVLPARVRDYQPAMLDELLSSGEIVWTGSKTGNSPAMEAGEIAFHPGDSILIGGDPGDRNMKSLRNAGEDDTHAGGCGDADDVRAACGSGAPHIPYSPGASNAGEPVTLPEAIKTVLASGGAYHAAQLAAQVRARRRADMTTVDPKTGEIVDPAWSDSQFEETLWALVWQGKVTNSSFAPVRALSAGGRGTRTVRTPSRASRRRMRVPVSRPATLGGLWSVVGKDGVEAIDGAIGGSGQDSDARSPERYALAQVEALLDRYGIIAKPLVDREDVPGGFPRLYPILRRMEERGTLVRGMFVEGFGAAQFADRDTVDALRDGVRWHSGSNVALDVTDPAVLAGSAMPWPDIPRSSGSSHTSLSKPMRRAGNLVVLARGLPVIYAAPRAHHLAVFGVMHGGGASEEDGSAHDIDPLRSSFEELGFVLRRKADVGSGAVFSDINGEPLHMHGECVRLLRAAGFSPSPQGMKLYR